MKTKVTITSKMIAPCGMNCALCIGHHREKKQCPGCRIDGVDKRKSCSACPIKLCENRKTRNVDFCFACATFPCKRLKQLDKSYHTKYHMSLIENLTTIKEKGIRSFVAEQKMKWQCKHCNNIVSVHQRECTHCGKEW